jgi:hypothetical protein
MRKITFLFVLLLMTAGVFADDITVSDDGSGVGTVTWTADNVYLLDGFVFVNDGQVLTIEAGTVIKGKPGQGESASALILAQGGTLIANGTPSAPIIFTAEADNGTMPETVNGQWGGFIMLGKAGTNNVTDTKQIEGIPTTETRAIYGGDDDTDGSGTLKYVSIRHGGTDIGEGNEINGLTMGVCGKNTMISHVEVVANKDDGVEFFGGMPRLDHILVAYCGDDSYDYNEGFSGYGQFWATIQFDADGDRMGEHDGGPSDCETCEPYAHPIIHNATYIGVAGAGRRVMTLRDNAGGEYRNSIFAGPDYTGAPGWFNRVDFKGAFKPGTMWAGGWTLAYADELFVSDETSVDVQEGEKIEASVYPNPVSSFATVNFDYQAGQVCTFRIYNLAGMMVREISNITTGEFTFNRGNLASGLYIFDLTSGNGISLTGKLMMK